MSDRPGITQELRNSMQRYDNFDGTSRVVLGEARFDNLCDQIDAIHAALEAENERLKQDVAMCAKSEQEKCIAYLRKENIDWEDKYRDIAKENAKLREQIDTLVMYVEADGTKYSIDENGWQHFGHSNTRMPDGYKDLEAENAKLSELVEIMMPMVMRSQRYCSYICDMREQCVSLANPVYGCIKRKDIMKRARELAIEVES